MEDEYEVYPNAPLRLVAFEVRYPFSPRLGNAESLLPTFHSHLEDVLPIAEQTAEQPILFVGPGGPTPPPISPRAILRLLSRSRTTALTVTATNTVLETTQYERYGVFRPLVERTLEALAELGQPVGAERLGLRYIDEIRVPDVRTDPNDWATYVQSTLLGPKDLLDAFPGMNLKSWLGQVNFAIPDNQNVVMRYGALEGSAVASDGPLRIPASDSGPFFVIDVDSFWAQSQEVEDFNVERLLNRCDGLHRPVRALFEASITDQLRNEVLRREETVNG